MYERIYLGVINLGKPITIYIDPKEDRARCQKPGCGTPVINPHANHCPYGHRLYT